MTGNPYAESADAYVANGWQPLPLPLREKFPPPKGHTGSTGRPPTLAHIERWKMGDAANVCLRMPQGIIGFDVDDGYGDKDGASQLAALAETVGVALPPTWKSTARGDEDGPGCSAIYLYRVPVGYRSVAQIAPSIESIQPHHRYVVAWPSIHPSGSQYRWYDDGDELADHPPDTDDLAELPWEWQNHLRSMAQGLDADMPTPEQVGDFLDSHATATRRKALDGIKTSLRNAKGRGRHDTLVEHACWAMRESAAGRFPAIEGIEMLRSWWAQAMDSPSRLSGNEFDDAIAFAVGQADADTTRVESIRADTPRDRSHESLIEPGDIRADMLTTELTRASHIPLDFWQSRPELAHVRQAGMSRMVAYDPVLHFVLGRVAAFTPHTIEIPGFVADATGLSYYAIAVGPPGAGKSSATKLARRLMPMTDAIAMGPNKPLDGLPIGSGEGLIEILFEHEEDIDGTKTKTKIQKHYGAVVFIDEGQALGDLGSRNGSTLMEAIRSIYTHNVIGQTNAALATRRIVKGEDYVYAILMGIQPGLAGPILADAGAGTPQRFAWALSTDDTLSEDMPVWPGPLDWKPLAFTRHDADTSGRWQLGYPESVRREVVSDHLALVRGAADLDPMEAHRNLVRLKMAGLLALLGLRGDVSEEDWQLAGVLYDTSRNVRIGVQAAVAADAARVEEAKIGSGVRLQRALGQDEYTMALNRGGKAAARAVRRHQTAHDHKSQHPAPDSPCMLGCISRSVAGRDKALAPAAEMADQAVAKGWLIMTNDGGYLPGSEWV